MRPLNHWHAMSITAGTRIGAYEVVAAIGAGGMGEVYRARDTKLHRDVALKILPEAFATDGERLARFEREAHVLAALNHPNIAAIYGVEDSGDVRALVMELVDGDTLADRLARGAMPVDEALPIARQIAEALEAAHEQGIIHRDLKPANIKLRADGTVKVLDFGLAKLVPAAGATAASMTLSPTITSPALVTSAGVLLGTAAYMSPEQAKGREADRRSDMWAFGCVLFEMLTGRRAFEAEDVTETLAFVITRVPDWSLLPAATPPGIARLLRRLVAKNPRDRLSDMSAVRLEIDDTLSAATTSTEITATAPPHGVSGSRVLMSLLAVSVTAAIGLGITTWQFSQRRAREAQPMRFTIAPPEGWTVTLRVAGGGAANLPIAISPDGRQLVMVARNAEGRTRLWLRSLDALVARELEGTDNAMMPFWSPDSRFVAFFADGKLRKVDVTGGLPVSLCSVESFNSGSWGRGGTIVFARAGNAGGGALLKVAQGGGVPSAASSLQAGDGLHIRPTFLPDGRRFLYLATNPSGPVGARTVYVASLDSPERRRLIDADIGNITIANGHLLFVRESTLMAQPFDVDSAAISGEPVPVADQLQTSGTGVSVGNFSTSDTGVLVYQTGEAALGAALTWFDRAGKPLGVVGNRARYADVELSPDGRQLAVSISRPQQIRDIWLFDLLRAVSTRFTFVPGGANGSVWSPDHKFVAFNANRSGRNGDLFRKAAGGAGDEAPLLIDDSDKIPWSWSPDGAFIAYSSSVARGQTGEPQNSGDLWILPVSSERKPFPFVHTPYGESHARFSPDGRWIAYTSNESGRPQVYVTPFPAATTKWQVSGNSGTQPRWRHDGKELFFLDDNALMAAAVDGSGDGFRVGAVQSLFETRTGGSPRSVYDVAPDGQRFLVETRAEETSAAPITVVVNWPAVLAEREH